MALMAFYISTSILQTDKDWGCPNGKNCHWAHGEEDLAGEAGKKARKSKEADREWQLNKEEAEYTNSMTKSYKDEADVQDMVARGLLMQSNPNPTAEADSSGGKKRTRVEEGDSAGEVEKVEVEVAEGGESFPILCISGDVDVTKPSLSSSSSCSSSSVISSVTSSVTTYQCEGISAFGTAMAARCCLAAGEESRTFAYQVTLQSAGIMQIGWAHSLFLCSSVDGAGKGEGDGCGDDSFSWGWDGSRSLAWNSTSVPFPAASGEGKVDGAQKWKAGDVLLCLLHVSRDGQATVSYVLNGVELGTPSSFESIDLKALQRTYASSKSPNSNQDQEDLGLECGLFPCFSVEAGESVLVDLAPDLADRKWVAVADMLEQPADPSESIADVLAQYANTSANASANNNNNNNNNKDNNKDKSGDGNGKRQKTSTKGELGEHSNTNATDAATAVKAVEAVSNFVQIDLEGQYGSSDCASLLDLGADHLKAELHRRGLKSGGTMQQRVERLWAVRGIATKDIDPRLLKKK